VRQSDEEWCAACEGREATSPRLVDAIREAVGQDVGEGLMIGARSTASLEQWIRETAAHIVGDTLH
jgi:hypothetical protein